MDACEALDSSDGSSRGSGPFSRDELCIVLVYAATIGLLLLGPQHILGGYFERRGKQPPFFLERTSYAPLLGLVLLAVIPTSGASGFKGIVTATLLGDVIVEQFPVVLLILGLAFMSVSVDVSGFFENVARRLLRQGGTSEQLTMRVFWLSTVLTYFTSNDMVIVSLTPLILELCNQSKQMKPLPMLIAKFIAANTSSIGLYIGNPTNILLADAVELSFLDYFLLMWPATIVAVGATWLIVKLMFTTPLFEPCCGTNSAPSDDDSNLQMPGVVPVPTAALYTTSSAESEAQSTVSPALMPLRAERVLLVKICTFAMALVVMSISGLFPDFPLYALALVFAGAIFCTDIFVLLRAHSDQRKARSAVAEYLALMYQRMPWCIAPFVVSMFCIVQAATNAGLVRRFASVVFECIDGQHTIVVGLFAVLVSSLLVNCINNLPATVLWTKVLPELCVRYSVGKKTISALVMGLLVGNNVGSYLTIVGALAGLMWMTIIRSHSLGKQKAAAGNAAQEAKLPEFELSEMGVASVSRSRPPEPKSPVTPWDLTRYGAVALAAVVAGTGVTIGVQLQV